MKKEIAAIALASVIAGATLSPGLAAAASAEVERAKDQCIIGEQMDGYLGIVDAARADTSLQRAVRDINQQRKAVYADLASRNGVTIDVTAALTAEKLINQLTSGQCYKNQGGRWIEV